MERDLPPTKRRLERARKEGLIPRGRTLGPGCGLLAVLEGGFGALSLVDTRTLLQSAEKYSLSAEQLIYQASSMVLYGICAAVGLTACYGVTSLVCELMQTRAVFYPASFGSAAAGYTLWGGFKKIAGGCRSLPWLLFFGLCFFSLWAQRMEIYALESARHVIEYPDAGLNELSSSFKDALRDAALCLIVYGIIEYALSWRKVRRELRMSAEEIRKELKEEEGDPLLKAQRRSLHESLTFTSIVQRMRRSKVLIVSKQGEARRARWS